MSAADYISIGLTDSQIQMQWRTAETGFRCRKFDVLDWADGEPNNYGGTEDCAAISAMNRSSMPTGKFNDLPCSFNYFSLCQI